MDEISHTCLSPTNFHFHSHSRSRSRPCPSPSRRHSSCRSVLPLSICLSLLLLFILTCIYFASATVLQPSSSSDSTAAGVLLTDPGAEDHAEMLEVLETDERDMERDVETERGTTRVQGMSGTEEIIIKDKNGMYEIVFKAKNEGKDRSAMKKEAVRVGGGGRSKDLLQELVRYEKEEAQPAQMRLGCYEKGVVYEFVCPEQPSAAANFTGSIKCW